MTQAPGEVGCPTERIRGSDRRLPRRLAGVGCTTKGPAAARACGSGQSRGHRWGRGTAAWAMRPWGGDVSPPVPAPQPAGRVSLSPQAATRSAWTDASPSNPLAFLCGCRNPTRLRTCVQREHAVRAGGTSDEADPRATCLAKSQARGAPAAIRYTNPSSASDSRPGVRRIAHGARTRLSLHPPGVDLLALADDAAGEPVGRRPARRPPGGTKPAGVSIGCRARRSPDLRATATGKPSAPTQPSSTSEARRLLRGPRVVDARRDALRGRILGRRRCAGQRRADHLGRPRQARSGHTIIRSTSIRISIRSA